MIINNSDQAILGTAAILFSAVFSSCNPKDAAEIKQKPNVIMIMTDDQGIGDFGFYDINYHFKKPVNEEGKASLKMTFRITRQNA
jgi:basic membrane lipoprotein Med (substrate-binding protein (PBP1-ABC) superfamily)